MSLLVGMVVVIAVMGLPLGFAQEGAGPSGRSAAGEAWRHARKIVVLVVGCSVVLVGIALIVLPGPAFVVIPAGLAILGTEFVWPRRLLRSARHQATNLGRRFMGKEPVEASADSDDDAEAPAKRESK